MADALEVYALADVNDVLHAGPGQFQGGHHNEIQAAQDPIPADAEQLRFLEDMQESLERKGAHVEMLQYAERALACRKELYESGTMTAEELQSAAGKLCVTYNTIGTKCFKASKSELASSLFARAMKLTDEETGPMYFQDKDKLRLNLRATTLNNMGCMERKRGNNEAALRHLRQCSVLEAHNSPATNLNISAILTQIGRHAEAIGTARRSIGLLSSKPDKAREDFSLLVIAYHNLAMAQECSVNAEDRADAKGSYMTALQIATKELGESHPTTVSVAKSLRTLRATGGHGAAPPKRSKEKHRKSAQRSPPKRHSDASQHEAAHPRDDAALLPQISPLAQVSQGPASGACSPSELEGMLTAESLQQELNPGYTGETGMILVEKHDDLGLDTPVKRGKKKKRKASRGVESSLHKPADVNQALQRPQPPKEKPRPTQPRPAAQAKPTPAAAVHSAAGKPAPPAVAPPKERAPRGNAQQPAAAPQEAVAPRPPAEPKRMEDKLEGPKKPNAPPTGHDAHMGGAEKRRGIRGHDETRDEDRKKEDAVAYMHQLLVKLLRDEDVYEQQFQAALRIQCTVRCLASHAAVARAKEARRREQSHRLFRENDSAKIITRFIRKVADVSIRLREQQREEHIEHERCTRAAISIQKSARGWLARRKTKWLRTYYRRVHWGTRVLQCFFRRMKALMIAKRRKATYIQVWQDKLACERVVTAAMKIQKLYRGYKARLLTDALRGRIKRQVALDGESLRQHAATRIAATWRGSKGRARAAKLRQIRIQNVRRREMKEHRAHCACMIQDCWRRYDGRMKAMSSSEKQKAYVARSRRQRREDASVRLQLFVRCAQARDRAATLRQARVVRLAAQKRAHAATIIAAMWRAVVARIEIKCRRSITNEAIVHRRAAMVAAAIRIQTQARVYLAGRQCADVRVRLEQRRAADIFIEEQSHRAEAEADARFESVMRGEHDTFMTDNEKQLPLLTKMTDLANTRGTDCMCLTAVLCAGTNQPLPQLHTFDESSVPPSCFDVVGSTEGQQFKVLIQDKQRVLYIDSVYSRVLEKIIWNPDTRYVTLQGVVADGADTVQIAAHSQLEAVAALEAICTCTEIPTELNSGELFTHNLEGAHAKLVEQYVVRLQAFLRSYSAKKRCNALHEQEEAALQQALLEQATTRLQTWFRQRRARRLFAEAQEMRKKQVSEMMEKEEDEYQDAAAAVIASAARKGANRLCGRKRPSLPAAVPLRHEDHIEGAQGLDDVEFDVTKFLALGAPESQEEHDLASSRTLQRVGRGCGGRTACRAQHSRAQYSSLRPLQRAQLTEEQVSRELQDTFTIDSHGAAQDVERLVQCQREATALRVNAAVEDAVNAGARRYLEQQQQAELAAAPPRQSRTPSAQSTPTPPPPEAYEHRLTPVPPRESKPPARQPAEAPLSVGEELQRAREEIADETRRLASEREAATSRGRGADTLASVRGVDFTLLQQSEAQRHRIEHDNPATRHNKAALIQRSFRCSQARMELTRRKQLVAAQRQLEVETACPTPPDTPEPSATQNTAASEDDAATRIQGAFKMRKARREMDARRDEEEARLQEFVAVEEERARHEASIKIQGQVRGKIARCDLKERRLRFEMSVGSSADMDNTEDRAATCVQTHARSHLSTAHTAALRQQAAAETIQRAMRVSAARREVASRSHALEVELQRLQEAAVQEEEQGAQDPTQAGAASPEDVAAAEVVQRSYRSHAARLEKQRRKADRDNRLKARVGGEDETLLGL